MTVSLDRPPQQPLSSYKADAPAMNGQEAIDFSSPNTPKDPIRRNRVAGEFEMPELDNYDLHAPAKAKVETTHAEQSDFSKLFGKATYWFNWLNIFGCGLSAFTQAISKNKKTTERMSKLAETGVKAGMGINAAYNTFKGFEQKEVFNVAGYLSELAIAAFSKYKNTGLLRGISFALYQVPKFLTSIKPGAPAETFSENFKMMMDRMGPALKKIVDPNTYTDSKNIGLLTGTWGGIFSGVGVVGWLITGSEKFGGWVKGIGEILLDVFQILPVHRRHKRTNYVNSGVSFIVGSLLEILYRQTQNPIFRDLYFMGSSMGRLFMTKSNELREDQYPEGGPVNGNSSSLAYAAA